MIFSGSILLQAVSSSLAAIAENPRNLYYWEFPGLVHFSALRVFILRQPLLASRRLDIGSYSTIIGCVSSTE